MLRKSVNYVLQMKIIKRKPQVLTYATQNQITKIDAAALPQYTPEESVKILKLINTLTLPDYESYNLSERRASKLLEWKNRNGLFQNIYDILLVDGFGAKVVEKFYHSLLHVDYGGARITSFLIPTFDAERRQQISSSVSLRIGVSAVSWARLEVPAAELNSPCLLTHWEHIEISGKKLHLQDLVERCLYVDHLIPEADCYIFENPQMAQINRNPGNAEQQNISIQKSQITAALSFALNRRKFGHTDTKIPNVFYLRRFLTARLFNHLIGTERVSSEETILKLMRTHYNLSDTSNLIHKNMDDNNTEAEAEASDISLCREVLFSSEMRQLFSNSERHHREFLGQCLLLNLAFVRLALLQDPKSIALVSRKPKKEIRNVIKTD